MLRAKGSSGSESAMQRAMHPQAHRFVVVYRVEAREIDGAAEVRRGWIERVPDPRGLEAGENEHARRGFQALSELPGLIAGLIEEAESRPQDKSNPRSRP